MMLLLTAFAAKPSPFKVQASPLLLIAVALLATLFSLRSIFVLILVSLPSSTSFAPLNSTSMGFLHSLAVEVLQANR